MSVIRRAAASAPTVPVALLAVLAVLGPASASHLGVPHPGPPPDEDGGGTGGPAYGTYAWPFHGAVIRFFDPPDSPYGAGHRGIDIAAPLGSDVRAAAEGVVAFAGPVAGGLYVSIDHPDGVRTTYSWLTEISARRGEPVERGAVIGRSGPGHPATESPHLHFGARLGSTYLDPLLLLERGSLVGLVRLAPLHHWGDQRGPPSPP